MRSTKKYCLLFFFLDEETLERGSDITIINLKPLAQIRTCKGGKRYGY